MNLLWITALYGCVDKEPARILQDTKAHLWFAQNTVLLYAECQKTTISDKKTTKEQEFAIKQRKKVCETYYSKLEKTYQICTQDFSKNINNPKAPSSDPTFVEVQSKLAEICSLIEAHYTTFHQTEVETKIEIETKTETETTPKKEDPEPQE